VEENKKSGIPWYPGSMCLFRPQYKSLPGAKHVTYHPSHSTTPYHITIHTRAHADGPGTQCASYHSSLRLIWIARARTIERA